LVKCIMNIEVKNTIEDKERKNNNPEEWIFGKTFTPHMFQMLYKHGEGWTQAEIKSFDNLTLLPKKVVFHYGPAIFDGLKAYYRANGEIGFFRVKDYLNRINISAQRMGMPEIDIELCFHNLRELVKHEKAWIKNDEFGALYIRPIMLTVNPVAYLEPSSDYLFYIVLSPVNIKEVNNFYPIKLLVKEKNSTDSCNEVGVMNKLNDHALSLLSIFEAIKKGFDQILWLAGPENSYIEESSSMNIFFRYKEALVTPALDDSICNGITRNSIIEIARHWKMNVVEDKLSIKQIIKDIKAGDIIEAFGSASLVTVLPIGHLHYKDEDICINDNRPGELSSKLFGFLTDIQHGREQDAFQWIDIV